MSSPRPTLYILDAYSRIYQVFHAIRTPMSSPTGQPTNAVFGIFRDLLNLHKVRKPDYLVAAFDGGGRVFRSDIFAEYKAQRGADARGPAAPDRGHQAPLRRLPRPGDPARRGRGRRRDRHAGPSAA